MSKLNLKKVKIAFFDLGGVLSVPRYADAYGNIGCSVPDDYWFKYCNWKSDVYALCKPIKQTKELLQELKKQGTRLYVLTHETNSGAYFNKVDFVLNNYREYFESYRQVLFVNKTEKKVDIMQVLCEKYGVAHNNCLLVEDTYDTCMKANELGYQAMHISELFVLGGDSK